MIYKVFYSCVSHIGNCREINQDNFFCGGKYLDSCFLPLEFPLTGCITHEKPELLGIFDGMGGEECGEVASLLASREAALAGLSGEPAEDLLKFCHSANAKICDYAERNGVRCMGTTAALLAFTKHGIALCNIGDSRIFRFAEGGLRQISVDHVGVSAYGMKPPLSQNLGIPPSEMVIDPYIARGHYNNGDIYLICSDGLTDMLTTDEITEILERGFNGAAERLLGRALKNGGKDNVTIIVCRVVRERRGLLGHLLGIK